MADGQVVFEIKGDPTNVNQTVKQVTNNIQSESKKWDQSVGESADKMSKSFVSMKAIAAGAIAAIGSAIIKFGKEAIDAASDLQEVQNVVDTVFGDGAKQIDSWAQKAGEKFGLTETMAKRFTSTLGAMMKSSGLAGKEIVTMSTDLAGLAADMASFYNLDFETAFEKIRSGISGETMPLKQLGINMSVANLEAFALAQGLNKTFSEMSQGEQTMLRYQYLMQATADAQGDFEKTSDGFANAQRRIQASLQSIETSIGNLLIEPFSNATAAVATFLSQIAANMMPEKTVIDEFNDINIDTETKLAELQQTYDKANDLIQILRGIESETATLGDGTTISLANLFGDIAEIEKSGGDINEYIASLGLDVDDITLKYNKWKEATKQLTSLVPSLTNVIDSETGAIDGGTDALQKNLDQWKKTEENKIYWAEYYAKAEAVARAKGEQAGLEITAQARQLAANRAKKQYEAALAEANRLAGGDFETTDWSQIENGQKIAQDLIALENEYTRVQNEADKAQKEAEQSANDLADAESLLADELAAVEEITGETLETQQQAAQQTNELTDDMTLLERAMAGDADSAKKLAGAWEEAGKALQAVREYYKNVEDATRQAVNSTVKGFESVTKAGDDLRSKSNELAGEETEVLNKYTSVWEKWGSDNSSLKKMKEFKESGGKLTDTELEAYEALVKVRNAQKEVNDSLGQYKPDAMIGNLEKQIAYMDEYMANLDKLKEWGVSEELLAQLSDGSTESAEYLAALVEGGEEAAKGVGEKFDEVARKKEEFTKGLTDSKLTADQAYQQLLDTAMNAVENLDLQGEAKQSMADTVQGIADGVNEKLPSVHAAVEAVIAELNRLSSFGINFSVDEGGNAEITFSNPTPMATGSDWIPYDNFPALLHQGEAVLTAEENKIWQMFKNGQKPTTMDYDALGGVMRDNVRTGGDVFLDGKTVGRIISDQQGRSYRALQRSGWQS